jgi:uncharacterized protein YggE
MTVEPDQAEIDIGVVSQAGNAPDAGRQNADRVARVLAEVKKIVGPGDEIKTASYSLNPTYRTPQGGKPEIVGYTATNVLRIKTSALPNVGRIIDAAMQAGANSMRRLIFTLKDEQTAQLQALRLASGKAKAKAEEMAAALGLKIVKILAVTEGERGARPLFLSRSAGAQEALAAPTPVESGTIEVRSSVTLTADSRVGRPLASDRGCATRARHELVDRSEILDVSWFKQQRYCFLFLIRPPQEDQSDPVRA